MKTLLSVLVLFMTNAVQAGVVDGRFDVARCGGRLENALDQMRRRQMSRGAQSKIQNDLTHFTIQKPSRALDSNVVISDLRVRMPGNPKWVRVDQCAYHPNNSSLDTKLLFPDLTISGSVSVRPYGASCNMILRLRRAGIKFTTRPLGRTEGAVSVRTDSKFTEPGFLSVFAHGCEIKDQEHRRNSKYTNFNRFTDRNYESNDAKHNFGSNYNRFPHQDYDYHDKQHKGLDKNNPDLSEFDRKTNKFTIYENNINQLNSREGRIFDVFESDLFMDGGDDIQNDYEFEDGGDATREMEDIFSRGIRGLLTSYMQKTLQPAIKETLMSSCGELSFCVLVHRAVIGVHAYSRSNIHYEFVDAYPEGYDKR